MNQPSFNGWMSGCRNHLRQASLYLGIFLFFIISACSQAQAPANRPHLSDPAFDKHVSKLIDFSVPVMSVDALHEQKEEVLLLDAREREEYDSSHIEGAHFLGYKYFDIKQLSSQPKDQVIVVYCSVGYRSEKIGQKLQEAGFTKVYNLYGSIFEWANRGYQVVDEYEQPTQVLHTYNRRWSRWVNQPDIKKVW